MDFNAPVSTWMPSPVVTLTFDLQNLVRSSAGASEYYLSVSCNEIVQAANEISW